MVQPRVDRLDNGLWGWPKEEAKPRTSPCGVFYLLKGENAMSPQQRTVAVVLLIAVACCLPVLFCDWYWDKNYLGGYAERDIFETRLIEIDSRSEETKTLDTVLGLVVPLILLGLAGFLEMGRDRG